MIESSGKARHAGRVVFVSDVHLYYEGEPYLGVFLDFLRSLPADLEALYIHGDLFDFYVGPRQGRRAFYRPLFEALSGLVGRGVAVTALHGNRDFLIGRCFQDAGVRVVDDSVDLELGGLRVHLSHGDAFCIHDHSYQFWARRVLRAQPVQVLVRSLPVAVAVFLARRYRKISARKAKRYAGRSRLGTILDGVAGFLSQGSFDAAICGHIHDLARTEIDAGGRKALLWTTGAWEDGPNAIEFDGRSLNLRRFGAEGARFDWNDRNAS